MVRKFLWEFGKKFVQEVYTRVGTILMKGEGGGQKTGNEEGRGYEDVKTTETTTERSEDVGDTTTARRGDDECEDGGETNRRETAADVEKALKCLFEDLDF